MMRHWTKAHTAAWSPEQWDAVLYGASALFALVTLTASSLSLYRQWALIALGPYLLATALSLALWRRRRRRGGDEAGGSRSGAEQAPGPRRRLPGSWRARGAVFLVGLLGATLLPLALEVAWGGGGAPAHVQPEVTVIEGAAHRLADGQDPYRMVVRDHKVVVHVTGQPTYELFFPYLPLMTVFGLPASGNGHNRLTDARIFFSAATLALVAVALALSGAPRERKFRALQALSVLPIAALPLATGGDDMPIVAFLLLAMVLAQRRQPVWSGLVLGVVSAMKFTAWPLAALALFAARGRNGRRAPLQMLAGIVAIVVPVVAPFLAQGAAAFAENVVLFPLGLSGVKSPAASPLPGHLLVSAAPVFGRVVTSLVAVAGAVWLVRRLVRRPPRTPAEVTWLAGWVLTVAILIAPATRIGYLLYPINFFVWSWLFRGEEARDRPEAAERRGQKLSETWISSMAKGVDSAPAGERVPPLENSVGDTTTATSQYQPSEPPF